MEKTSDQAWELFRKSKNYELIFKSLCDIMRIAGMPEYESIAKLTIQTCFTQGYIYRNL